MELWKTPLIRIFLGLFQLSPMKRRAQSTTVWIWICSFPDFGGLELGIIFWLLAQCERDQSSSSRRHLEAAGDEHGAGPLFLEKDKASVQVMVTAPGMGSDELWMSFGFALQKSAAFPRRSPDLDPF